MKTDITIPRSSRIFNINSLTFSGYSISNLYFKILLNINEVTNEYETNIMK